MTEERRKTRIGVIGLGNELMADDGLGVHAIRRLCHLLPAGVVCFEIGTAALRAEALCEQVDLVIAVDAVQAGGRPGDVYVFDLADAAVPAVGSLHSLSLAGVIGLMDPDRRPRGLVVGVEPARVEYDVVLSEPVRAALPHVIRIVCEIVRSGGKLASAAFQGRAASERAPVEEKS
ncbi:MAG: hydrogenase maturation protease [Phycisphaerae bacterium]|nr:hydrogenase maturation protease [Phycisphaerae bacterium]